MPAEYRDVVKAKLNDVGIKLVCYGVVILDENEAKTRQVFDFCKAMGIETITSEPSFEAFDLLDRLTVEYGINIAIHNHPQPSRYWDPKIVLKMADGRNPRIGACADTGHWLRSGLDPAECLKMLEGRIISLHFKDLNKRARDAHDVPWGTGVGNVEAQLAELHRQGFEGVFSIEYEHNWTSSMPEITECITYFNKAVANLQN
jgi:sugar phosphate isomerase/epimerase